MELRYHYWELTWTRWLLGAEVVSDLHWLRDVRMTTIDLYFGPMSFGFEIWH